MFVLIACAVVGVAFLAGLWLGGWNGRRASEQAWRDVLVSAARSCDLGEWAEAWNWPQGGEWP